ncbi:MAG: DNA adenine methylase [Chloroflexota bacterium]
MRKCVICESELSGRQRKLCGDAKCKNAYQALKQKKHRSRKNLQNRNGQALRLQGEKLNITSPPIRYFGGKWRIASWIMEQFPPHTTYVEPFCGGASILFRKQPSQYEVLNDLNSNIVTFFDVLRSRPQDLINVIQWTPYSREEHRKAHFDVPINHPDRPLEIARRFYVRSRQSFGSGEGQYTTGWRYQKNHRRGLSCVEEFYRSEQLYLAAERLKSVQIECDDAIRCIQRFDSDETLFYVDPPYVFSTRHSNEHDYAHELTDNQHVELADVLKSVQGMVLLSGYSSPLYEELYEGWRCITKGTRTNGNNEATECLWISPNADDVNRLPIFSGTVENE